MGINQFLDSLFSDGEIVIASAAAPSGEELKRASQQLLDEEIRYRETLPLTAPEFDPSLATECCVQLHQALQFLGFRDIESDTIDKRLDVIVGQSDPKSHYSVDVVFRFLPSLAPYFSRTDDQQLASYFNRWVARWPLSSVGIKLPALDRNDDDSKKLIDSESKPPPATSEINKTPEPLSVSGFWDNECLRNLYLDRIIACQADDRIDTMIAEALKHRAGIHTGLLDPKIRSMIDAKANGP